MALYSSQMLEKRSRYLRLTRRGFVTGLTTAALTGTVLADQLVSGVAPVGQAVAAMPVRVGVLYRGGRGQGGHNQSHAVAAGHLTGFTGITVTEIEVDPADSRALAAAAGDLAGASGCRVILVTSIGDDLAGILAQAAVYPDTVFILFEAPPVEIALPPNVGVVDALLEEAQHVAGIVAGYSTRSKVLGFVADRSTPRVLRCVNAFMLGARRADPSIKMRIAFVADGEGHRAREAAHSLIEAGSDVLAPQLREGRAVVEAADGLGVMACGLHVDQSMLAPRAFLTGAEWDWRAVYTEIVGRIASGQNWPRIVRGGFSAGLVRNSAYGPQVPPEGRAHADAARMQLANGNAAVFRGPIRDNTGRMVVGKGALLSPLDPALGRMVWLVEGISTIDG